MPRGKQAPGSRRQAFYLGEWLVEPDLNRIMRNEERVQLEFKVMEVLVYLACHGTSLVTRRQLIDGVWDGGFISDNTLTHAIAELRRALGDNATNPTYIETIHRKGYRLVREATDLEGRPPMSFGRPSRFRVLLDDRNIQLREGENLIGRIPEALLYINSAQVSRRHARIIVGKSEAYIEDLDSKNGTSVNGRRVHGRVSLEDGDRVFLGDAIVAIQFIAAGGFTQTDPPDSVTPTRPMLET
jgi:DNA-binding winged helix-turn-helix (wHTH) protein